MKILIVSQFFWPEQRTAPNNIAALAGKLASSGHEVMVITGIPNHPRGRFYPGYRLRPVSKESHLGAEIVRLPLFPYHGHSPVGRLANYLSFAMSVTFLGTFFALRFRPDALFCYLAPTTLGLPAFLIRFLTNAPLAFWITDIWAENLRALGFDNLLCDWVAAGEKTLLRAADLVCLDSPGFESLTLKGGIPRDKTRVVIEWADEGLFRPEQPDLQLARKHGIEHDKFVAMYAGNMGSAQGLDTVLRAGAVLRGNANVQFVLVGDGTERERLVGLASEAGLDNVVFIDRQPMDQIRHFIALADLMVVHLIDRPIFRLQMPSKVIAYMACGKPSVCAFQGAAAQVVLSHECGFSCPPEDSVSMAAEIQRFASLSPRERGLFGSRARKAYLDHYTLDHQAKSIEHALLEMAHA
ncbi:MAG: glycosyltransferase family 4 protein [Rhodothermales bacterium]|nr:glycosyltransferase family 4 protein [Rhodothermales bacterium]MBO6781036.1 glycosyltransferase family 4 protein [Rhodothermales bacterium]